jgi:Mg-chelatase subunit ChlD
MNPDFQKPSRDEIEVRLTALLLGELPAEEAELLRWAIAHDAELARLHERLKVTIGFVREVAANPTEAATASAVPLKLSEVRREKLLAHFKTIAPQAFKPPKRRAMPSLYALAAVLVLMALLAALLLPALSAAKLKSQRIQEIAMATADKNAQPPSATPQATVEQRMESVEAYFQNAAPADTADERRQSSPLVGATVYLQPAIINSPTQIVLPKSDSLTGLPEPVAEPGALALDSSGGVTHNSDPNFQQNLTAILRMAHMRETRSLTLAEAEPAAESPAAEEGQAAATTRGPQNANGWIGGNASGVAGGGVPIFGDLFRDKDGLAANRYYAKKASPANSNIPQTDESQRPPDSLKSYDGSPKATAFNYGNGLGGNEPGNPSAGKREDAGGFALGDSAGIQTISGNVETASAASKKESGETFDFAGGITPSAERDSEDRKLDTSNTILPAPVAAATPPPVGQFPTTDQLEKLKLAANQSVALLTKAPSPAPNLQPEILTSDNAISTFSLNVSDVSFELAAASLQNGVMPEPASIRSEEFINAFNYRDPEAPPGVAVAFAWERAHYPFAHNRDLLRFSIKTAAAGRAAGRPLNLVLLLDTSGSMERADRVAIIHEALRVLATQLHPQDTVSVVTFARTARLWADGVPGDQAGETLGQVGGITPEGGTNLEEAMRLAYETARRHYLAKGMNRVVLLTDGAANLGDVDPDTLKQKVEANREQGIAFDCFGIGWEDYNDDLLEQLSSNGDGRYAFLNSPEDAAGEFAAKLVGALQVAAEDVKVQVEFNPQRVVAYRQIGYAKHQLTKEQFRDNTVAAGAIAAQEAGNALYMIEMNPQGDGPVATVRVRYKIPGTTEYRENEWDVPYTGRAVPLEQSSAAMRLAATAGAFSEWLASSPYAQEVTPDQLLNYLSGVPEIYGADPRPKQLEWMIRQAKSISGK